MKTKKGFNAQAQSPYTVAYYFKPGSGYKL